MHRSLLVLPALAIVAVALVLPLGVLAVYSFWSVRVFRIVPEWNLDNYREAIEVLANTHVLPSENARESHRLYALAHVGAALDELDDGNHQTALDYLEAGLLWPESLGQGRPYDPDERLVRFLQGVAAQSAGDRAAAFEAFESVAATMADAANAPPSMRNLLSVAASENLAGRSPRPVPEDAMAGFMSGLPEDSQGGLEVLEWRFITRALQLAEQAAGGSSR